MFLIFAFGCITLTPLADKYGRWPMTAFCLPIVVITMTMTINPPSLIVLCIALVIYSLVYIVRGSVVFPFSLEFALTEEKIERIMVFNFSEGVAIIIEAIILKTT